MTLRLTARAMVLLAALVLGGLVLLAGCQRAKFYGKDREMMHAAKVLSEAINEYYRANSEYPDKLREVEPFLPVGTAWPLNPYTGTPVEDTGSMTFDPATSVGMVAYERVWRDEQQTNYQLHVYGEHGRLYVIGNTAVRLKE
jgi:hypothetical protein